MKKISLSAGLLKIVLFISLFLIIAVAVSGFVYSRDMLSEYALQVSRKWADAEASENTINDLKRIQEELVAGQDVIEKTKNMKAGNDLPQFKIIEDVSRHAEKNGITIASFDFTTETSTVTPPASTGSPQPSGPAAAAAQPAAGKPTVSLTVSLSQPVNYSSFLQFQHDIENNLPKLKIKNVSLTPTDNGNEVTVDPMTIEMYTR